ncbi:hypothetical protein MUK42_33311 [Musa troglodytarum]|uniref:Uncharacterized protein n=1 Tax=Musa troglodytarum TaxID=320322 RepID=A0A9E7IE23_9LILI|nr:hypothetical protein MUK42_33311 [Musa troglodytarum]
MACTETIPRLPLLDSMRTPSADDVVSFHSLKSTKLGRHEEGERRGGIFSSGHFSFSVFGILASWIPRVRRWAALFSLVGAASPFPFRTRSGLSACLTVVTRSETGKWLEDWNGSKDAMRQSARNRARRTQERGIITWFDTACRLVPFPRSISRPDALRGRNVTAQAILPYADRILHTGSDFFIHPADVIGERLRLRYKMRSDGFRRLRYMSQRLRSYVRARGRKRQLWKRRMDL